MADFLPGSFQKGIRFVFQGAVGIKFKIGRNIGLDGVRVVFPCVNLGEQNVGPDLMCVALESIVGAPFGFREPVQRKLRDP